MITNVLLGNETSIMSAIYMMFLLEVLAAQIIYIFPQKRRDHFICRLSIIGMVALLFVLFMPSLAFGPWSAFGYFLLQFVFSVLLVSFCFDVDFRVLLFCCSAGYCTQNIMMSVFSLSTKWLSPLLLGEGAYAALLIIIRAVSFTGVYWLAYFSFMRKFKSTMLVNLSTVNAVLFVTFTIITANFINCFSVRVEFELMASFVANRLAVIICNVLLVLVELGLLARDGLADELKSIRLMWQKDHDMYKQSKENMKALSIRLHDIRHFLYLPSNEVTDEAREELKRTIRDYDIEFNTGNEALDVVLTEKMVVCMNNEIEFTAVADGAKLDFIKDSELYSLFGNILDNAIEGVVKLDKESRIISLKVAEENGSVVIQEQNYFNREIKFENNIPITTRSNKELHGYGVKSIALLAKKYGGEFLIETNDKLFTLKLGFPVQKTNKMHSPTNSKLQT